MKILIIVSTLDLQKPFGATPALWQLFKGFYEIGDELIVIPYSGRAIDSLWWRTYPNPTQSQSDIFLAVKTHLKSTGINLGSSLTVTKIAQSFTLPKWRKTIMNILKKEKNIDAVMLVGVPLNHFVGLPTIIKKEYEEIPVIFYDLDVPTSLPENEGFSFKYYEDSNLTEYDGFIIPSEGCAVRLKELGAREVGVVHFGVDPDVYTPVDVNQTTDIFFFGNSSPDRKKNIDMMITEPSKILSDRSFVISSRNMSGDIGNAKLIDPMIFSRLRFLCCQSKINLNSPRASHAETYCTSTSRLFELSALECCIVSGPYLGLEKWFKIGKEMYQVSNTKECVEIYNYLLDNEEERFKTGKAARVRILKEHTHRHRARQIRQFIQSLRTRTTELTKK